MNRKTAATARHDGRLDLRRVTLVCVEGRHPDLALHSLRRCMARAEFGEVLLFGPAHTETGPQVRLVPIDGQIRGIADYSRFLIEALPAYIRSDFVLVVQWDSFILDTQAWRPEFLDYDYIGAPWPHRPASGGNGGFSLRSRRLLQAAKALGMSQTHPEDYCIAELYKEPLEQEFGIRFAPCELAQRFAFERSYDAAPSFGFHGFFNFDRALDTPALSAYLQDCPPRLLCSKDGRQLAKRLFRAGRHAEAMQIIRARFATEPLDAALLALRSLRHQLWQQAAARGHGPLQRKRMRSV